MVVDSVQGKFERLNYLSSPTEVEAIKNQNK